MLSATSHRHRRSKTSCWFSELAAVEAVRLALLAQMLRMTVDRLHHSRHHWFLVLLLVQWSLCQHDTKSPTLRHVRPTVSYYKYGTLASVAFIYRAAHCRCFHQGKDIIYVCLSVLTTSYKTADRIFINTLPEKYRYLGTESTSVCLCVCGSVTTITQNCVHRSSPKGVSR